MKRQEERRHQIKKPINISDLDITSTIFLQEIINLLQYIVSDIMQPILSYCYLIQINYFTLLECNFTYCIYLSQKH